jgi:hypothetical protein
MRRPTHRKLIRQRRVPDAGPVQCVHCGAADSRGPDHQGGCPSLPRLTNSEVFAMMRRAYGVPPRSIWAWPPLAMEGEQ